MIILLLSLKVFAQEPKLVFPIGHEGQLTNAKFSPDGKRIATVSIDKTIKIWDFASGLLLKTIYANVDGFSYISFSPDSKTILIASVLKSLPEIWNIETRGPYSLNINCFCVLIN